jgi:glycosyltransferase involved in cell wall biosynthesis
LRTAVYRGLIAPTAERILCVSEGVAASLAAEGIAASKLQVVPNGVTVDDSTDRAAARRELGLGDDRTVIGMVARLRPEKRHELALEALALLRSRDKRLVLCVVGDGPLEGQLRKRAKTLGVDDAVVWAGERPNAQRLMRAFDVLLLCSSYEGMPLAVLEALVSGVPVVSTAVGSLPELLADGGGELAATAEPQAIAEALTTCLRESQSEAARTASQALSRSRFGIDRLARDLEAVYDAVLGPSA